MVTDNGLTLGADFPRPTREQWRSLVDEVLKGGSFEDLLVHVTDDGLRIEPLYTRPEGEGPDPSGVPGLPPFTRGATAAGVTSGGWDIRQYHRGDDLAAVNAAILADLEGGATSVEVGAVPVQGVDDLDALLDGVLLDVAPVALDWGPDAARGARWLVELWERRGVPSADAAGELGLDPLGVLARHGWAAEPLTDQLDHLAATAASVAGRYPRVRTARVDAAVVCDAGGSDAQELAFALAGGVAYVRAMTGAGCDVDSALAQLVFRLAATPDQFATMAKLRAARRCWSRVAQASGATEPHGDAASAPMVIHAVSACAHQTQRDPWVNVLRGTVACFAAATSGADVITVLPLGAAAGRWDDLTLRLARNTQIVLAEESGLSRVADPAGGSWYVEERTEQLAAEAWARFQAIEAAGGLAAVLADGSFAAAVEAVWNARRERLAHRTEPLTGVSEFPNLDDEAPRADGLDPARPAPDGAAVTVERLPLRRHAAPFEALRDRADAAPDRPTVFLANLGPVAAHTGRATWATNFFAAGGIRALTNSGFADAGAAAAAFTASGSQLAVICSSDKIYAELAVDCAQALKAAGCTRLYLAGAPGDRRADYEAAGVDEFVAVGCDALDILDRALDTATSP